MRVLLVNSTEDSGGASRAAHRLYRGLADAGIDAQLLTQQKNSDDPDVISSQGSLARGLNLLRPRIDQLPLYLYETNPAYYYSTACLPWGLQQQLTDPNRAADIVHLHWINGGFIRIETLAKIKRPLIWTLHDMWALTGGCHYNIDCTAYQQGCGHCPALNSKKQRDLSFRQFRRKQKAWQALDLHIVTPSQWLKDSVQKSPLLQQFPCSLIPNGIDTQVFQPINKSLARSLLKLPQDKHYVLFGAIRAVSDTRKGLRYLHQALQALKARVAADQKDIALLIFGASAPISEMLNFPYPCHYLGHLHDDISLNVVYSAADVFVAPSVQDNLPNTVMEALTCGVPAVAFDIGGMPDLIRHKHNGYLADAFNSQALAEGIRWVLSDVQRHQQLAQQAREYAVSHYSIAQIAQRYQALYQHYA
jgi:glycosyltransferase involved in cell wall biosynthesis